ncbi:hypothetical protein [Achromobacter xylosoxidans]|uniref:hypothetical protein n=1 Tax=Alcaligenes xylosoxydans xylosoxydans TaxID=85698 RepID=UPI0006C71A4D|nr:hypothetical protein [Achromobacter xylosoxidans]CUI42259.1 Uncharacterised protein [Achromobacter xylosoxidans]
MTTHTPAPAQGARLTDDEIRSIWVEHGLDDEAVEDFARAIESALLSKLRAPVADDLMTQDETLADRLDRMAFAQPTGSQSQSDLLAAATIWRKHVSRPASAPVAEEALTRFCPECGLVGDVASGYRSCCPDGGSARMIPVSMAKKCRDNFLLAINRDAAPQASEAVRDAGIAASVDQLVTAAKGMTKLYPHVWDRTDGSLVVFPENVAQFDAAFDAVRVALGEAVEDDDSAALSAQPGAQKESRDAE